MAVVGVGLAPVTIGASIGLSVGGVALAVAGGSTAAGTSIADVVIQKTNIRKAQDQLTSDYDQLKQIIALAEKLQKEITSVRDKCPAVSVNKFTAVLREVLNQSFIQTSNLGIQIAELAISSTFWKVSDTAVRVGEAATRGIYCCSKYSTKRGTNTNRFD